jgi:tetratricopeptide (TPR) repeat protein
LALAINPDADASAALVRADVLVLLREKRYEEALARLYQARTETPDSVELQKGIDQVKEFLIGAYAKRLGGLDQVARQITPAAGRSPDIVLLSRYIDGASTYGDLAEICPLGRLRTLQVLIEMYARQPASSTALAPTPEAPHSGPRPLDALERAQQLNVVEPVDEPVDEPPPETARSSSSALPAAPEDPQARRYREAFALGTAAFIQNRFADAIEAFEACAELRPGDAAAAVMLRRARRDLESR